MAVAFIALLAALGGTAVALPGKNGVKKDDIAKGAVNTTDIANNTIRGGDVRTSTLRGSDVGANTLTGSDINEASLGTVQSANTANSAGTAGRAGSAGAVDGLKPLGLKRVASSATSAVEATARTAATEVPLYSFGTFSVYGKCFTNSTGPNTIGETYIRTGLGGAIVESNQDTLDGNPFLDPATLEVDRVLTRANASANDALADADDNAVYSAAAPDGTVFTGQGNTFAKNGTLPGGDGIYGAGSACVFYGHGVAG